MKIANEILVPELARLLAEEKEVRFTPSGVSMRPYIEGDRDSVILAPLNRAPRVGDILLAEVETLCGNKTYVLHRLIRIEDETLVLQGDGNLAGEERCNAADVIGRVTRIRLLGTPRPASVTGRGRAGRGPWAGRGGPVWRVPGLGRFQGLRRPRASPPTVGSARAVPPGTSLTGGWGQCPPEGGDRKVIRVSVRFGER